MDSLPRPSSSSPRLFPYGGDCRRVWPYLYRPVPQGRSELVVHRISQVPRESVLYLCPALRPRPVRLASPWRPAQCSPHKSEHEDTSG